VTAIRMTVSIKPSVKCTSLLALNITGDLTVSYSMTTATQHASCRV